MKTRTKILIAVVLGFLVSWLIDQFQILPSKSKPSAVSFVNLNVELIESFQRYNQAYFNDRLPKDTVIDFSETQDLFIAQTTRDADGNYRIAFNKKYVRAITIGDIVLLHELCHIPTYDYYDPVDGFHGPAWRACMIGLDIQDAFRHELIDTYRGR